MNKTIFIRAFAIAAMLGLCSFVEAQSDLEERDERGRRIPSGETTTLAFRNVTVDQLVPFIVESTGKVVVPRPDILSRRITILNDAPIPQREALDLVFLALQQEGIAVVETRELVILRDIAEIVRQDVPVIGPEESVLDRRDLGVMAEKVFALSNTTAEEVAKLVKDGLPDYAKVGFDKSSNTVVVLGNIGMLQRVERLVRSIDQPSAASLMTETFKLRFADATQVSQNIRDLYEDTSAASASRANQQDPRMRFMQGGGREQTTGSAGPTSDIRVTANTQQNSVTVLANESIIEQVRTLIRQVWDQPLSEEAVVPRIYDLKHSDPVKVQALLEGLFGTPSAAAGTAQQGGGGGTSGSGVGRLAGQFAFEAIPEAGRLVVVAKSPDNLFVIDEIIRGLDQPQTIGLPEIVELSHADAEELSEQINTVLATEGTIAQLRRQERGLTATATTASPFSDQAATNAQTQDATVQPDIITFWWQRAQTPTDSRGASNLVGKIRVVPVWRQNAVMILAPPEYRSSVAQLVSELDRPGRQVLISAVVAEISAEDSLALGLRWSSSRITPSNPENAISVGLSGTGVQNDLLPGLFDTSVLNANVDLNLVLQALDENADLRILSEPRIFTSDNQEAEFFDGQDIPFITDSQTTPEGGLTQSTDYRAVGIQLRARPRITPSGNVDLRVNLELSSIQPGLTLNNQFIVDRRETSTQLIVRDGQTVVISGILRSQESDILRKVPLLGDIPLIGLLFQSTEKSMERTELVAFITPRVVQSEVDLDRLNEGFRRRLEELRQELGVQTDDEALDYLLEKSEEQHRGRGESAPAGEGGGGLEEPI